MSNEQLRKDTNDDRARNAANESHRPGQLGDVQKSAGSPSTNPATIPTKPCGDATSCEMPLGSGVQQQIRTEQPAPSGASGKGAPQRDPSQQVTGDVRSRGEGSDGFGGAGAGTEHTRGAHASGQKPDTKDDRHPGSGWRDERSVTPPATQQPPRPQPPGRPKDQTHDQRPVSTTNVHGGDATGGGTTNRPGGNPNVTPRTGEKTKTYEGPTGVSGEAGSNADDV